MHAATEVGEETKDTERINSAATLKTFPYPHSLFYALVSHFSVSDGLILILSSLHPSKCGHVFISLLFIISPYAYKKPHASLYKSKHE